ncbi:3-hydroxyacyl-[acyl-carrier-protein] dehydratase [Nicoletella semolina]|uniref:3-hydroxyacyl-[acyl-carrier-protein] dehydratase n=1 Tax=Nicoletella semolina TaxID=271160 RepID=A0A4R2NBJ9_9PAST|nr:hypothetical protein [Nicoletella semolina]MDH2924898.1 hypothetical protein [Nicoletella semolina]TCP18440.1 3-hydroxyacyl-[acyl-carrier-protein] dehydratase [Nicoletella semolina]
MDLRLLKLIFNNPHRFPINLVDKLRERSDSKIITEKFIAANDYFFKNKDFMLDEDFFYSELLILESFFQSAGLFINDVNRERTPYVICCKHVNILGRPVIGSIVQNHVELLSKKENLIIVRGKSQIDNNPIMEYKEIYIGY